MNYCVWLSYLLWTMRTLVTVFDSLSSSLFCLQLAWVAPVAEYLALQGQKDHSITLPVPAFKISPYCREALALSLEPELEVNSVKYRASQELLHSSAHRAVRSMTPEAVWRACAFHGQPSVPLSICGLSTFAFILGRVGLRH